MLGMLAVAVFRRVSKIVRSDCQLRHVCLSARPEQFGLPHWAVVLRKTLDLSIFRKPAKKIQVSLKSDKNSGYFT